MESWRSGRLQIPGCAPSSYGEQCDPGSLGETAQCTSICTASFCGDGIVDLAAGEFCDPGPGDGGPNGLAGYNRSCTSSCTISFCGDGIVDPAAGEQCDPGAPGVNVLSCNSDSTLPSCGDGITNVAAGEQCDTGGANTAQCNGGTCKFSRCGDGYPNSAAGEQCDNGPQNSNTADCNLQCQLTICGDGIVDDGGPSRIEVCDLGAATQWPALLYLRHPACAAGFRLLGDDRPGRPLLCGDGVLESDGGEKCDFGARNGTVFCVYGNPTATDARPPARTPARRWARTVADR